MKVTRTSRIFNKEYEIIEGLKFKAIGIGAMAVVGGFGIYQMLGPRLGKSQLLFMGLVIALPLFAGYLAQKLLSGLYPCEGLENELVNLMGKTSVKALDLNREVAFTVREEKIFTSSGDEVLAFEMTSPDQTQIAVAARNFFLKLPYGHRVVYMRDAVETKRIGQKRICETRLYGVFTLSHTDPRLRELKAEIRNQMDGRGRELSLEELTGFFKQVINKNTETFRWELRDKFFLDPISMMREEALLHFGDIEERAICLTLADLPERIGPNFQLVLDVLNSLPSTVTVSFKPMKAMNPFIRHIDKKIVAKRLQEEQVGEQTEEKRVNYQLCISALVHGSKKEIADLGRNLDDVIFNMPDLEQPKFARDNAHLKAALKAIFPGAADDLPGRHVFRLYGLEEAMAFVPSVVPKGDDNPLLDLKTTTSSRFGIALKADEPIYLWGGMGSGKTAIMNDALIEYLKGSYRGERRNVFVMTAGDGYHWLLDGVSDLSMIYVYADLTWKPLSFHPLKGFFSYGSKGIEEAGSWVAKICGIEDSNLKTTVRIMLKETEEAGEYKISDFYRRFESFVYKTWPEDKVPPDHYSRRMLSKLMNYAAIGGSLYGSVFEPEAVSDIDFLNVKTFYVTQEKAEQDGSEILSSFFDLAACLFRAWDASVTGFPLLINIDELAHLMSCRAITAESVDSLLSQGRKQAKYLMVGSQKATDINGLSKNLIDGFQRFFFASSGPMDVLSKILRAGSDELQASSIKRFEQAMETINMIRGFRREYAWGYIDKKGRIFVLLHDLDSERLWLISSDKPARDLKAHLMKKFALDFFQCARVLALYGPSRVPREEHEYPKNEILEVIYGRIVKHDWTA